MNGAQALILSLLAGVIGAFLQITAAITLTPVIYWVLFGIAVAGAVFAFVCRFMDYSLEKELRFDRDVEKGNSKDAVRCTCKVCNGSRLNPFALAVTLWTMGGNVGITFARAPFSQM